MIQNRIIWLLLMLLLICVLLIACNTGTESEEMPAPAFSQNNDLTAEEIYEMVSPSVVEITGETRSSTVTGSGFFFDKTGTVITNYHVIENCKDAKITLSNGQSYQVTKVLGYNIEKDIAILSTKCSISTPLSIRTTPLKTGETVYAIGSSLGLTGSLSDGIVSSAERNIGGNIYIQTTAPISQGNSGGPLIDKDGNVVGITCASITAGQNLNLAIPISEVDSISTNQPVELETLFQPQVEYISNRIIEYHKDKNAFILFFQLLDEESTPMSSNGYVGIRIINDKDETVFSTVKTFSNSNFGNWYWTDNNDSKYLAAIYINESDIEPGGSSKGTIYFTVAGDEFFFDETSLSIDNLPLKQRQVQWISQRKIQHNDSENRYILFFEVEDEEKAPMSCSGSIDIRIENEKGETVLNITKTFTESDFGYWSSIRNPDKQYLVAIYINDSEIKKGKASKGTIFFSVYGENYYFSESSLNINDLPVMPTTICLPNLPLIIAQQGLWGAKDSSIEIDSITYEIKDTSIKVLFNGKILSGDYHWEFSYKLYDSNGYFVEGGNVYILSGIGVGDKFNGDTCNTIIWLMGGITPGECYRLEIMPYK